jgi:hypothetical protein
VNQAAECLPSKHKALSSNFSTAKNEKFMEKQTKKGCKILSFCKLQVAMHLLQKSIQNIITSTEKGKKKRKTHTHTSDHHIKSR